MLEKENRPTAATVERSGTETAPGKASLSNVNSNIDGMGRQPLRVADFLNVGEAGAIPMRDLKTVLQMDSRTIRLLIEQERRNGIAIVSNNVSGYYLASNKSEKDRFVRSMLHRAAQIAGTAKAAERVEAGNG